jgi:hypothetical protein
VIAGMNGSRHVIRWGHAGDRGVHAQVTPAVYLALIVAVMQQAGCMPRDRLIPVRLKDYWCAMADDAA